jgi:hypothetical protein
VLKDNSSANVQEHQMSRNSKNSQRAQAAKVMSQARANGNPGPAKTAPKHGKKNAWWQKFPSYGAFIRGGKKQKSED